MSEKDQKLTHECNACENNKFKYWVHETTNGKFYIINDRAMSVHVYRKKIWIVGANEFIHHDIKNFETREEAQKITDRLNERLVDVKHTCSKKQEGRGG